MFKAQVRLAPDDVFDLQVSKNTAISALKTMIRLECDIPEKEQKLYFFATELTDEYKSVGDYGIKNGSIIDCNPKQIPDPEQEKKIPEPVVEKKVTQKPSKPIVDITKIDSS